MLLLSCIRRRIHTVRPHPAVCASVSACPFCPASTPRPRPSPTALPIPAIPVPSHFHFAAAPSLRIPHRWPEKFDNDMDGGACKLSITFRNQYLLSPILANIERVVDKYKIRKYINLQHEFTHAKWDVHAVRKDVSDGAWEEGVKTWGDKTVEVIGTSGSSGIQIASAIHPKIKRMVNYARGRTWISPVFGTGSTPADDPIYGILGLAWPAISNLNENPFFVTIANAGAVDSNHFSFYLATPGPTLYLGRTDENKYSGDEPTRGFEFICILPQCDSGLGMQTKAE
ncbi:hypothetical protein B0H14DRAFT_3488514 [Mycena olivaceomarginata]|nr:hypothetical protein B0H14DRAFT_3488514 [Mycena olivaceomarginata]